MFKHVCQIPGGGNLLYRCAQHAPVSGRYHGAITMELGFSTMLLLDISAEVFCARFRSCRHSAMPSKEDAFALVVFFGFYAISIQVLVATSTSSWGHVQALMLLEAGSLRCVTDTCASLQLDYVPGYFYGSSCGIVVAATSFPIGLLISREHRSGTS